MVDRQAKKHLIRLLEWESGCSFSWLEPWMDLYGLLQGQSSQWPYPLSTPNDRRYGMLWPIMRHETQLAMLRAPSRLLSLTNPYARGIYAGLESFVIGDGWKFTAEPKDEGSQVDDLVTKAQKVIDDFTDDGNELVQWPELLPELFNRRVVDGEYFLQHWMDDGSGKTRCWPIEPELIYNTQGMPDVASFGIVLRDPDDMQSIESYEKHLLTDVSVIEWVDARDMVHWKNPMVPRTVKRGIPDFTFGMFDALTQCDKLRNAMGIGGTILASIPYIRQHATASLSQVSAFQAAMADNQWEAAPPPGTTSQNAGQRATQKINPGEIQDINAGQEYVEPPGASNYAAYVETLHMLARAAGIAWNMPEWLATGSGADIAAYSGSLTQQNPFVRKVVKEQKSLGRRCVRTMQIAIEYAIERGELPANVLDVVKITFEAPDPTHKDRLAQAQEAQILIPLGVTSRQTEIRKRGDDPEHIEKENEEFQQRNGPQMEGLELPGDEPPERGGGSSPKKPSMPSGTPESLVESKDSSGHEHKGKGEGGGQFTAGSADGSGDSKTKAVSQSDWQKELAGYKQAGQQFLSDWKSLKGDVSKSWGELHAHAAKIAGPIADKAKGILGKLGAWAEKLKNKVQGHIGELASQYGKTATSGILAAAQLAVKDSESPAAASLAVAYKDWHKDAPPVKAPQLGMSPGKMLELAKALAAFVEEASVPEKDWKKEAPPVRAK